jgi:dTDP-4-amino-4,6-dideoxygalactose transaminase
MINVTRSFMPPIEEYEKYLEKIWENRYLTNEGPLVQELKQELSKYLKIENVNLVTNGTLAIQLAVKALGIDSGEIITTPFTYVATISSIIWERCTPVFVDIDKETLCINANKIEEAITPNTKAILGVHVYGIPCDVEKIDEIAKKHNLKVIYDGAHAFGSIYKGKSLLSYGDVTTCSFHATKVFHTIEGGACFSKTKEIDEKIQALKTFGEVDGKEKKIGINAKLTEFNAAMGLANLKYINEVIEKRKTISELYDELLEGRIQKPKIPKDLIQNYIYYPVIFKDEEETLDIIRKLNENEIYPRRYFYPSLNKKDFLSNIKECPISEDISKRIICLPLYPELSLEDVRKICDIIK